MVAHRDDVAAAILDSAILTRVSGGQNNDVVDGHMVGEQLKLLDEICLGDAAIAEGRHFKHAAACCSNKQDVD